MKGASVNKAPAPDIEKKKEKGWEDAKNDLEGTIDGNGLGVNNSVPLVGSAFHTTVMKLS